MCSSGIGFPAKILNPPAQAAARESKKATRYAGSTRCCKAARPENRSTFMRECYHVSFPIQILLRDDFRITGLHAADAIIGLFENLPGGVNGLRTVEFKKNKWAGVF